MFGLRCFIKTGFSLFFLLILAEASVCQEKRAMTLEDLMYFQSMGSAAISDNGRWIAYEVRNERSDGLGVVVSSDGQVSFQIERAEKPVFSSNSSWMMFTQVPPFHESEGKLQKDIPRDKLILLNLLSGSETVFHDVKKGEFSQDGKTLLVHHTIVKDTLLSKDQEEKFSKAGTQLRIIRLQDLTESVLDFVDSYTVDSLSRNLVFFRKDTLFSRNGLYHVSLPATAYDPSVIDTLGQPKFSSFSWYEKNSILAYVRASDSEIDTVERSELSIWKPDYTAPDLVVGQNDAPDGLFLPFDNSLTWSSDGNKLFFGFREKRFSKLVQKDVDFSSPLDSLRSLAQVDVWHLKDPRIKTHEKASWPQMSRQNLLAVYHVTDRRVVPLADEDIRVVQVSASSPYLAGFSSSDYSIRATWDGNARDFYVINIVSGEKQLVAKELRDMASVSPTGRFALFFKQNHWRSYNILTGSMRVITGNSEFPFFDENHDTPSEPSSYRMMGWMDDGVSVILYDKYDIWLANLEYGELTNITKGRGRADSIIFRIVGIDSKPLFSIKDQLFLEGFHERTKERALFSARLTSPGVKMVMDAGKNLKWRMASRDLKTFVYTRESYNEYPDLWVTDSRFRSPVRLSNLSNQLDTFNWGISELIDFENADGVPLQGVLIKPGNFDEKKKYPVFVYYYEKSSQRLHEFNQTVINHRPSFGYYASNGYCVFLPDIHFDVGYPGMSAVKSLVPGVQKLMEMGVADPEAIGLHGHSWSGYQTAFVITQTDAFKAAIAGAPVSNMTSAYSGIRWGTGLARQFQYEKGQSRIGPSMFENLDLYIQNSPVFFADKINTPLLLMHGDTDEAVPWEQSIELYLAMRRLGKDVIFLQYRDEPHHPQKYPNKIDYTIRMKEYFDYHLRGMEPARWISEGRPYNGN
jgi:dienelactone hydrolase